MTRYFSTATDAIEHAIIDPLEWSDEVGDAEEEFDVRAIFGECFKYESESQSFYQTATEEEFWDSVERNAL